MKGDLKRAEKLYKRHSYTEVIRLLEPQIFRFRQSHTYFYLVGMSCLHTGDLGGASTYLQRGLGLSPQDIKSQLGLATVHIKRQQIQEAIRCYLEIVDNDPGNKYARRGLNFLKKNSSPERLLDLENSTRLKKLMPAEKRLGMLAGIIAAVAVAAAAAFLYLYTDILEPSTVPRQPEIAELKLEDIGEIVDLNGDYRYILEERDIEKAFRSAQKNFSDFRDNLSRRDINTILGSNASQIVKEKARTIARYLAEPDFSSVRDTFSYEEVNEDPYLYHKTYVVWRGKVSNLVVEDNRISFDLLVGYEKNEVLLGVIPVLLDFAALIDQGDALEILAQVMLDENDGYYLRGVSIHKLSAS